MCHIFFCNGPCRSGGFRGLFRLAQALGLFPVSGLSKGFRSGKSGKSADVTFKPISFRLLASVFCIVVLAVVEGK